MLPSVVFWGLVALIGCAVPNHIDIRGVGLSANRTTHAKGLREKPAGMRESKHREYLNTRKGGGLGRSHAPSETCQVEKSGAERSARRRTQYQISKDTVLAIVVARQEKGTSRGSHPFTHSMNPHLHPRLYHGCYGDIMTMETFGAPCDINNLLNCGIHGSEMFAEMDLKAITHYRILIKEVGQRYCIDPAIIAAIISRESHGGVVLQNGWDHKGQKFGLMQLDKTHHPIGSWDSKEHLLQSVGILAEKIKAIQRKFPTWNTAQHLRGGLVAFKSGLETIVTPEDIEVDLVDDVIARAKFYKRHGF
ncbi:lysozyme g-like protein 2 [Mesocricetus auratus]|uniref:Lysozyme g-like protein 2 n=1 Tax=Mesocricetus auratus TaxID=10036 RepID=A0ABM2W4D6_MESAU|nr:lysozyme g-like protein 2 [Mesocricetus auratus]